MPFFFFTDAKKLGLQLFPLMRDLLWAVVYQHHTPEGAGSACRGKPRAFCSSGHGPAPVQDAAPDGEHMESFVLSSLLFWLPWVCQVAE